MSDPNQLVTFFLCGHREMTIIDTERPSETNRNFWSKVKNWTSSPSPSDTKYQQSASLCTQCRNVERKQIEEAPRLQVEMAQNAIQQLKAQGRLLAAPPAQGVNDTIRALILAGDKAVTETLLKSKNLKDSRMEELDFVDYGECQLEAARHAQRDLDRAFDFWENIHHEHATLVRKTIQRSGPIFCPECKKMGKSLANPEYRRQAGYSDVKLPDGEWYGSKFSVTCSGWLAAQKDPWSIDTSLSTLDMTEDDLELEPAQMFIPGKPQSPPLNPAHRQLDEQAEGLIPLHLTISNTQKIYPGEEDYESPTQEVSRLPDSHEFIDSLADITDITFKVPVQGFIQDINHDSQLFGQNAKDIEECAHLRELEDKYLKVSESRQVLELANHSPKDHAVVAIEDLSHKQHEQFLFVWPVQKEMNESALSPIPQLNYDKQTLDATSNSRPNSTTLVSTLQPPELEAKWRRYRFQYDMERQRMPTFSNDMKPWETKLDEKPFQMAISIVRPVVVEIGKKFPPLSPQDREELKAVNSGERWHDSTPANLPDSPSTNSVGQSLVQDHGQNAELLQEISSLNQDSEISPNKHYSCMCPSSAMVTVKASDIDEPASPPSPPLRPRRPSTPDLPPIDPFSPVGLLVVRQIRNFFYIPAEVPPSRFSKFMNSRVMEGMLEARVHAPPSFGVHDGDLRFRGETISIKSNEKDLQSRREILDLCGRIEWLKDDLAGAGKSLWEESSDCEEDGDEKNFDIEDVEKLEVDKFVNQWLEDLEADSGSTPSLPTTAASLDGSDMPLAPQASLSDYLMDQCYGYEASEEERDKINDHDDDETEVEVRPRLVTISAPITEDPKSPYRVKRRSLLRVEVIAVNQQR